MKKALQIVGIITLSSILFYSCSKKEEGCTDKKATNFHQQAEEDDGSCTYCAEPTNPECPNYDPCYEVEPITAQFDVSERLGAASFQHFFAITTDKFLEKVVKFEAKEEGADYTWTIGSETIHTRSFIRSFVGTNLIGQTIPVTLVVEKTPNLSCNPTDDGRDSITRSFEVVESCSSLMADTFLGVWEEAPLDTFELAIKLYPDAFQLSCYGHITFWNFNKQQVELKDYNENISYHYIRTTDATPSAPLPDPIFQIWHETKYGIEGTVSSDKKTVVFDYYIHNYNLTPPITYNHHHFIGRKKH